MQQGTSLRIREKLILKNEKFSCVEGVRSFSAVQNDPSEIVLSGPGCSFKNPSRIHHHLRKQIPAASGGSAQTQRERPNSAGVPKIEPTERILSPSVTGAPKLCMTMHLCKTLTAKLCCLEGLAILVSKALVLLSQVGSVG